MAMNYLPYAEQGTAIPAYYLFSLWDAPALFYSQMKHTKMDSNTQ
jgi:hypothetical protein